MYKGQPEDPNVEGNTFHWVVHGRKDYTDSTFMFTRVISNYEKLYPLDILGVEDQGKDDQLDVCSELRENLKKRSDR